MGVAPVSIQIFKAMGLLIIGLLCLGCAAQATDPAKPHHTKDGFRNIDNPDKGGFLAFLKWRWEQTWKTIPPAESFNFPLGNNDPLFLRTNQDRNTLTWIGHATVLFQLEGKNILTDPHFSRRASPVQWAGPERAVPPGIPLQALPPIDMVVISHDHFDSLDTATIRALRGRAGGDRTHFLVPLGLGQWFQQLGIDRVTELDWWDEHREDQLKVTAVPVHHWSKRGLLSRNKTLWAGWVIQTDRFRFFFAGDSGYSSLFHEIGRKLGPFDLSAIPIGAYEPRWFMRQHHMSPAEAVQVHLDVGSRKSVAIHWGTFVLTDEPLDEPPVRLEEAMKAKGLRSDEFLVLKHGETIFLE